MRRWLLFSFILIIGVGAIPYQPHVPVSLRQPHFYHQRVRSLIFNETVKWLPPDKKHLSLEISRAITTSAARYGHDPILILAMIMQESSVRPNVRGAHGEIGLMQLKVSTAKWIAKRIRLKAPTEQQLFEPQVNIELGAAYLAYLREHTGATHFIQAYNCGPGAVRRFSAMPYTDRISKHYRLLLQALEVTDEPRFASLGSNVQPGIRHNQDSAFTLDGERSREGRRFP